MHIGIERRLTLRLLAYWERLRGARLMPEAKEFNPEDIHDLWDYCFIVDVEAMEEKGCAYTHLGCAIIDAYREVLHADVDSPLVGIDANKLLRHYRAVIEKHKPVLVEDDFRDIEGTLIKFRQCLLPFGEDENVRAILGGMCFRVFPGI